jgi:hypothetical protein
MATNESLVVVSREEILRRIRAEYLEMPGLRLSRPQAQRLWGLDEQTCAQLLESLTEEKFLYRRDDGMYARLTEGAVTYPPLPTVKAERVPRLAGGRRVSDGWSHQPQSQGLSLDTLRRARVQT